MSSVLNVPPSQGYIPMLRQLSVAEYHRMIQAGILTEDDAVELLEGYLVQKMPRNPVHDRIIQRWSRHLYALVPAGWDIRVQCAATLPDSEPEPDFAVVRGDDRTYDNHHPGPSEIGLLVEVANTTLPQDRVDKQRIYARNGIVSYWIANLVDRQVEVYTQPSGVSPTPAYAHRQDYPRGAHVPLLLDGLQAALLAVEDLLP
ncbi:MAG: Uma2 family endonuclease [Gemmataceae bacterium]